MRTEPKFDAPLPFFLHGPSERVLYVARHHALIFTITFADLVRHVPAVNHGPVLHTTTHPFGLTTAVTSLAEDGTRRGLADTTVLARDVFEETLILWADFCEAVAEALSEGKELELALATTWVIEDSTDANLHDDAAANTAMAGA